jgi:hypothetical protein
MLLKHKADVDAKTKYRVAAVYAAAREGHETAVQQQLEHKADGAQGRRQRED